MHSEAHRMQSCGSVHDYDSSEEGMGNQKMPWTSLPSSQMSMDYQSHAEIGVCFEVKSALLAQASRVLYCSLETRHLIFLAHNYCLIPKNCHAFGMCKVFEMSYSFFSIVRLASLKRISRYCAQATSSF